MTAPTIPAAGQNPASPGQRQAARDHVILLRQHGGTYRSIAAAAALSPATVCYTALRMLMTEAGWRHRGC